MRRVDLRVELFSSESARAGSEEILRLLLAALCRADVLYLQANPNTPDIFKAGVRYRREPDGIEEWRSIPYVIANGEGDCEDLACWLAAQERVRGVMAEPHFYFRMIGTLSMYHIVVRYPDGRIVDPSALLGMGSNAPEITGRL